jgi:hypothetical protein
MRRAGSGGQVTIAQGTGTPSAMCRGWSSYAVALDLISKHVGARIWIDIGAKTRISRRTGTSAAATGSATTFDRPTLTTAADGRLAIG